MRVILSMTIALLVCMVCTGLSNAQAPPVAFAEFEDDANGWWTEEHAYGLIWEPEGAGPGSQGSISVGIDPDLPDDDSPESKVQGQLPEGVSFADYEYISFYYKCDSEAYTGGTMFVMPMNEDWSSGGGASHSGTMVGDGEWHYEEYHMSEFVNWWGGWNWEDSYNLVLGIWETNDRGPAYVWYDHVMLFNESGEGLLLSEGGTPEVILTGPAEGETLESVDEITITFNQEVEGVEAGDLLVNGEPATDVSTNNNVSYVFTGFPEPTFPDLTGGGEGTVTVEVQPGNIQSTAGEAFEGYSYEFSKVVFVAQPPTPFADFEDGLDGWWTEEHAHDMEWVTDDTAAPSSNGAIKTGIDPDLPDDDSPESKVVGNIPEGVSMGNFQYISFYYKCDSEAYTGSTMFVMPMVDGGSAGAGASHGGSMIGDGEWHYEEYHRDEFELWWGEWTWASSDTVVIGVWETNDRGPCNMWYDHVMLFNEPGQGLLDGTNVANWSIY